MATKIRPRFLAMVTDKFKHRVFKNQEAKVRFFATAYNYGFMRAENEIEAKQFQKSFPYGINHKGEQVAYSDLAIEFLNRYATEF